MSKRKELFSRKLDDFFDEVEATDEVPLLELIPKIKDRYCEFKHLDEGGLKVIQSCRDLRTGRFLAMATLKNSVNDKQKEAFLKEARLTAALQHPNIIPLYDLGLHDQKPWFTMKLISGASLEKLIAQVKVGASQQAHDLNTRLDIFIKVCDAVAYAHSRGVLHLDIKPDNIQISEYGDVLLCDWGLAKVMATECDEELLECYSFNPKDVDLTLDGLVKGTPSYMAPEQTPLLKTKKGIHTDIFSLGCVLYKILTFEKPFTGKDVYAIMQNTVSGHFHRASEINPSIPPSLEAVCIKAMATDPEDRYKSVLNLQKEILNYRNGFATKAENAPLIKIIKLWLIRHKTLSFAAIIIFCISLFTTWLSFNNLNLEKVNAVQNAQKLRLEADKLKLENEFHKKFNKDAAPRFFKSAQIAFNAFNFDDAINFSSSAVELDPSLKQAWALKGQMHLIYEQFGQALDSLEKSQSNSPLHAIAQDFYRIKANDKQALSLEQYLKFYQRSLDENTYKLSAGLSHQKAYAVMDIEKRIALCKAIIILQNKKNLERNFKGNKMQFHYDLKSKYLDLSNNPWMETALILQNFPARSADFSHTGITNFICFKKQELHSLNVSHTPIIELNRLDNPELISLNISHTAISNLHRLRNMSLRILDISHSAVRSTNILKDLTTLEKLSIHQGQFSDAELQKLNPKLEVIIKP
ncbi:protein kinase [Lentisphaera profundi]|uniref:Protein kinase n=1 Tax=Lentisphaera profundi TaxID=1658616 RepID=A0ABY7W0A9_9BACT|nr:serine/threonine-protein kinase [Lentisphaera profundi]WDE98875.1 protein kinase [Lentisphaera profundi]